MASRPARILPVTASQALFGQRLIGGPLRLCGWSFSDGLLSGDTAAEGSVTAPAAGTTIASLSLGNGTYLIHWSVELTGTPGAGEVNNVALFIGGTQIDESVNLGAVGAYPQQDAEAQVTFGPLTLAAKAIGIGTAGAVYTVNLVAIPMNNSGGTIADGKMPVGFINILPGQAETRWFGHEGIDIETELSITVGSGTISGVFFYHLESDVEPPHHAESHRKHV